MPLSLSNLIIKMKPVVETALVGLVMVVLNAVILYVTGTKDPTFIGAYNVALAAILNWATSHARELYMQVLEAAGLHLPDAETNPATPESGAK